MLGRSGEAALHWPQTVLKRTLLRTVADRWRRFPKEIPPVSGIARTIKNGTIVPFPREQRRARSYLLEAEVERLMWAVRKHGRHGHRDATMILVAYRHGLGAGELVQLQWSQVHLESATLAVQRFTHGKPSSHPLSGPELRALRRLRREQPAGSRFVFVSECGAPMTTRGFAQMLSRAAERIAFPIAVHPHMLRHACGFPPLRTAGLN
jgi:type 1 fimbriae regulatory protein FimB/type 1 fimbriae regulatory protein FimE